MYVHMSVSIRAHKASNSSNPTALHSTPSTSTQIDEETSSIHVCAVHITEYHNYDTLTVPVYNESALACKGD